MNTREKIVATALSLFGQHGYEKTSIRIIAREANISLGLMYNYFKSKEALLEEIIEEGLEEVRKSVFMLSEEQEPIKKLVTSLFNLIKEKRSYWQVMHSIRMQNMLIQKVSASKETLDNYILTETSRVFKQLGHLQPMHEALILYATIDGIAAHYLMNEKYPIDQIKTMLISNYSERVTQDNVSYQNSTIAQQKSRSVTDEQNNQTI